MPRAKLARDFLLVVKSAAGSKNSEGDYAMRNRTTLIFVPLALLVATAWPQLALAENQITTFDPPGAGTTSTQGTFPQQVLNSGAIVGYLIDANDVAHGFIRSPHG